MTLKSGRSARTAAVVVVVAIGLFLPQLLGSQPSQVQEFNDILSEAMLTIALNIAAGFAGQFVLGVGAVFAVGGYAAAITANHQPSIGFAGMVLVAVVAGTIFGVVVGLPALRVGGFYLGVVTLFAAIVVPVVAQNASWAGSSTGIALFANPDFVPKLDGPATYQVFVGLIVVVAVFSWALLHSRLGRRFLVLASSEQLAASVGVGSYSTKMIAVLISSAVASVGGAMYAYSQQFFSPGSATVSLSILVLAAAVIGGLGTITGPIVGALIVFGLNTFLSLHQYNQIVFAVLLIAFVMFAPRGLVPAAGALLRRIVPSGWLGGTAPVADTRGLEPASTSRRADDLPRDGVLGVAGARRTFGGVTAVDGVSLQLQRGSLHGLIGSNGSGKTTLLNLISGFYRLDEGSITNGPLALSRLSPHRRATSGVSRTFQTPKLMEHQTALDNTLVGAELAVGGSLLASILRLPSGRRAARQARERALAALARVGLSGLANSLVVELPHGTRRLVELARAIASDPEYLLVDEPAAGLSEAELVTLIDSLNQIADNDVGVLLIEHNVPMVLGLAKEVTALHQGRILFQGTPEELRADSDVAQAFLGDVAENDASHTEEAADHELL